MTVPSENSLALAAGFEPADRERWRELALGVLRKSRVANDETPPEAVEELLATTTYDGIRVSALYTAADAPGEQGVPGFPPFTRGNRLRDTTAEGGERPGGWDVRQRHADPDVAATKAAIAADLENGVTSLWLVLGEAGIPVDALPEVLADVYLGLAPISLDAGAETREAAEAFLRLAESTSAEDGAGAGAAAREAADGLADSAAPGAADGAAPAAGARGNLGADPIGLRARTGAPVELDVLTDLAQRTTGTGVRAGLVDATVYHDAGGSDAQELGFSIATGVAYLRALTDAGLSAEAAFAQLEFRYAATADQFLTIAKLRAARRLWARVAELSGAPDSPQHQHAVTSAAMMAGRDPWVNLLRTTLACFGAGIGGANAVTVVPFDAVLGLPDAFSRRIARNTQSLLLEESSLGRVLDPAGGSWYVESLTDELARAAWDVFTDVEKAGGIAAALESGHVENALAEVWERRRENIAHRRDPLTGVSEFPNLTEKLPSRKPAPAVPGGGLPRVRYGQDFENLRDAADRAPTRPQVFLATLGPLAAYTTRATFAANLFQAGGIETVPAGPNLGPDELAAAFRESGARIAVLCSTDKIYAADGEAAAAALQEAGAARVWLAGRNGTLPNVDSYVFSGCDAVAVLTTTLDDLGVAR
ncbi:methylmalonyl-CoA mutase family protein [Cryptosporangium aurantiacum]|uniref:methylmalonyl-CoA mutase n=1 Tax=Cryptosporangium aurantiacum TaxID=134849 RepID=A0A1M7GYD7_9ACTN|nr:methylmalonyl-CoA mutase family protein [Cryptosporangium aurantiacum]SHM21250.1 heterodimeric methylmalonyl-CoA mutase small subunit [Cryptosporangium aurantiacum]